MSLTRTSVRLAVILAFASIWLFCSKQPLNESDNKEVIVIGTLSNVSIVDSVYGVVKGDNISDSLIFPMAWDNEQGSYNTTIEIPEQGRNFTLEIWVLDSLGHRVGHGAKEFSDLNAIVNILPINAGNALPAVSSGNDTIVSVNDSVALYGTAADSFGGNIIKWEWDIGNTGTFVETGTGDTLFAVPETATVLTCLLRVTDDDSNVSMDAVEVNVIQDAPSAGISGVATLSINSPTTFTAQVSQDFGNIVKYRWGSNLSGSYLDSSGPSFTHRVLVETTAVIMLEVTDDDGNGTTATKRWL